MPEGKRLMSRRWTRLSFLTAFYVLAPAQAEEPVIRFVAPENLSMPLAAFKDGQLTGGIIKDLGEAIAEKMERKAEQLRPATPERRRRRGRVRYALVNKLAYDYETRTHPGWQLREDLTFDPLSAACAFSLKSPLPFEEIDATVDALIAEGRIAAILGKYR